MLCINWWAQPHPATLVRMRGSWSSTWLSTWSSKSPPSFRRGSPPCSLINRVPGYPTHLQWTMVNFKSQCRWYSCTWQSLKIHDFARFQWLRPVEPSGGNEWVFRAIQNFLITKLALLLTTTISLLTFDIWRRNKIYIKDYLQSCFWRKN